VKRLNLNPQISLNISQLDNQLSALNDPLAHSEPLLHSPTNPPSNCHSGSINYHPATKLPFERSLCPALAAVSFNRL
jgi:hypothetical protein